MLRRVIRERLQELGRSQGWLAREVGIAPQSLSAFLNGRRSIPFAKLEEVFRVLNLM